MKTTRGLRIFATLFSVAAVVAILFGLWTVWIFVATYRGIDLGSKPPKQVFEQVFAVPPSANFDEIKIAGASSMSGEAWIRLHVKDVDSALKELKQGPRGLAGPDECYADSIAAPQPGSQKYVRAVGWEGVILVDRQSNLLFMQAQLY